MTKFIKRFTEWLMFKSKLDGKNHLPPLFSEQEVWWCAIGENVGIEISGKGDYFRRPVLIIRKLDAYSFIGMPLTRTIRNGTWYGQVTVNGSLNTVIMAQVRHYDYRRLDKRLCVIRDDEFNRVLESYTSLFVRK